MTRPQQENPEVDANKIADSTWVKIMERFVVPIALSLLAVIGGQLMNSMDRYGAALEKQAAKMDSLSGQVSLLGGKVDQGLVERINSGERRISALELENKALRDKLDTHIINGAGR